MATESANPVTMVVQPHAQPIAAQGKGQENSLGTTLRGGIKDAVLPHYVESS
ncbi:UNVERIFIED_CONTAM: hypothetical protein Sradi_4536300 [Sesamum radiatum]|uniref:Uncharacterized protein n=1 Tax=Sesamum radiatum TaxID=300843 RepID=A0AAW2NB81_SESRA